MNLHVTNDSYGLYPVEIAKKIKDSANTDNNRIVNLFKTSVYTDSIITYIPTTDSAFKKYISGFTGLDKIIFHPYTLTAYRFLKLILKKFPDVKIYWMCWSYELYNSPRSVNSLYGPFSTDYLKKKNFLSPRFFKRKITKILNGTAGKNYESRLYHSRSLVHYFCSPFYSDYRYLQSVMPEGKIKFLPIGYLSLDKIMPGLEQSRSKGNKIMIGHSSKPDGNHYEIIEKLSTINPDYAIFLPLSYGDKAYGDLIKKQAGKRFRNVEVLEKNLERDAYYEKLSEVGWAIFNVRVQQAVGNIIALIWMGAKVFLDKEASTYNDFLTWGINIYNVQEHLNEFELSNKLSFEMVENNRKKILEKFNETAINQGWKEFLF